MKLMKIPALRKSKCYINTGSIRHHNNCGSTHPSMAASEENKLPPSFSGFKSQKFLHESSYDVPWSQRFFLSFLRERDQEQAAKRRHRVAKATRRERKTSGYLVLTMGDKSPGIRTPLHKETNFVPNDCCRIRRIYVKISGRSKINVFSPFPFFVEQRR